MYFSYCILTSLSISKCIVWTNLLWSPEKKRFVSSASQIWMIKCAFDSLVHWEFGLNEQHYYWDKTILVHPKLVLLHFINRVLLSIVCVSLPLCCPSSTYDLIWLVLLYLQTFLSILLKTIITSLKNKCTRYCINNSEVLSNYYRLILSSLYTYIFDKFIR